MMMAAALVVFGAAPAIAAPGGVPGPPDHAKAKDKVVDDEVVTDDEVVEEDSVPEWAKAYGKRIKDMYGVPFGHLQQCAGIADDDVVDGEESSMDDDDPKKALEACPEDLEFPEDETGAKAFWVFTESQLVLVGI